MTKLKLLLLAIIALFALPATAANFKFLRDTVLTELTADETKELRKFVSSSLENAKDQEVLVWHSSQSPMTGKLKIKFSFQQEQTPCRRTAFILAKNKHKDHYQFDICKHDKQWQIEDTAARNLTDADWELLRQAGEQALTQTAIGIPFSWHNPNTQNFGVITATAIKTQNKNACRMLAITVFDSKRRSSNGSYLMCQQADGNWQRDPEQE